MILLILKGLPTVQRRLHTPALKQLSNLPSIKLPTSVQKRPDFPTFQLLKTLLLLHIPVPQMSTNFPIIQLLQTFPQLEHSRSPSSTHGAEPQTTDGRTDSQTRAPGDPGYRGGGRSPSPPAGAAAGQPQAAPRGRQRGQTVAVAGVPLTPLGGAHPGPGAALLLASLVGERSARERERERKV